MPARLPCCALQIGWVSLRLAANRIKIVDPEQRGPILVKETALDLTPKDRVTARSAFPDI